MVLRVEVLVAAASVASVAEMGASWEEVVVSVGMEAEEVTTVGKVGRTRTARSCRRTQRCSQEGVGACS